MRTMGIAGGIGSGKSVASRILRLRGEAVYDCDLEARRIMDESEEVLTSLRNRFGGDVCPIGGPIDRKTLATHVFGSDEVRLWLNAMVHRLVREDILQWREALQAEGKSVCYVESAIPATSGLTSLCDEILLVTASDEVRISRVKGRDNLDTAAINARIRSQQEEERMIFDSGIKVRIISNNPEDSLLEQLSTTCHI